ncbi:MAG: TolC family protein [Melioribacteraceae bacterium]|nr:TolC family protein [Melioribacteraceae bacterium]
MMKLFYPQRVILTLLVFVFTQSIYFPQEKGYVKYLTMEEAISRAIIDNNMVKSNKFAIKKANWDVKRAWAELFPVLSFNTRYNWIDDQTFAERDFSRYFKDSGLNIPQTVFQESYYSSFDLSMPLFNGVLLNGLAIAYEQELLSEQQTKSVEHQVVFNVITSYLNVLKNNEFRNIQNEYLGLSKLNYEKAQRLYEANRYSQNEALRWKIDFQQQKSTVANSNAELRNSLLTLSRLVNAEIDSSTIIDPAIIENLESEKMMILSMNEKEILQLVDLSDEDLITANASLAALSSGKEVSRLLHKNSYSSFMPKVNLNYSYAWRENNTLKLDDYSPKNLMISLSVPIFSGFQNYTALKSSFYEFKKNEEEFKDQLINTKLILNNVANNIINLKAQLDLLSSNLELSKNNYSIVERQRERGLVSNIDYIDAKLNMQNANLDYISNNYNFIISIVELYYLTGKIENLIY